MTNSRSDPAIALGLEGVIACETSISSIDGLGGILRYRGYDVRDFVDNASFPAVIWLLWQGTWPTAIELDSINRELAVRRGLPPAIRSLIYDMPIDCHPTSALRTSISMEGMFGSEIDGGDSNRLIDVAVTLQARIGTHVGAIARRVEREPILDPDPDAPLAADLLRMIRGRPGDDLEVAAFESLLVTYAEHELNASTFTARTVVSTLSDYHSAVVAGIAALKGPLHGGAIDSSMRLLREVREPDNVSAYLDDALHARKKIPGFGHRVYRTRDPRTFAMDRAARVLGERGGEAHWHEIASRIEAELQERKGLNANVDYYSGLVLYLLGVPLNSFTNVIAVARLSGWTAHIIEQYGRNRLIRPRAIYRGDEQLEYHGPTRAS